MALDQDLAELIDGPPAKRTYYRAPKPTPREMRSVTAARLERLTMMRRHHEDDPNAAPSMDMTDTFAGVSVGWLSKVFGMDPSDVKKRLADCPAMKRQKSGYVYSLPVAARFLVKPEFDADKFIRSMKPSELPPQLQSAYWQSALMRQKWEENAGHLWRTESVMEVLGDTFKTLKNSMQLFADNLERLTELSDKQREILVAAIDGLQDDMYKSLVDMASQKRTVSSTNEMADVPKLMEDDDLI